MESEDSDAVVGEEVLIDFETGGAEASNGANMGSQWSGNETDAREGMRGLKAELEEDNKDPSKLTMRKVVEQLDQQQQYYEAGKNTENRIMDAGNLLLVGDNFFRLSKQARANANAFDINDFLEPLRMRLGFDLPPTEEEGEDNAGGIRKNGELGDWEKIGWMATRRARTVMGMESINGMMAVEHKKRVAKKRAKQVALGAEVRPTELKEQDMAASKNETTENVRNVYRRLQVYEKDEAPDAYEGVNFYEWIINPDSFSESVENLFYTSFLIREGKLAVNVDEQGVPRMYDAVDGDNGDPVPNTAPKIQEVLQFDMDTWKQAIKLFNIKKPLIPSRGAVNVTKDSWAPA